MAEIRLQVNGEEKSLSAGTTLLDLLKSLTIDPGRVACELNMTIVRRADYGKTVLKPGDTLEIVQMIGGG